MSPKLKVFSGNDVIKIFERYGAVVVRTAGSHVRIFYKDSSREYHITIPLHKELKKGTLKAISKDFVACFGKETCKKEFY